jgi:hypothetical protein
LKVRLNTINQAKPESVSIRFLWTHYFIIFLIMLYQVHLTWAGFKLAISVVIGTDCIGSCKSNYHMIMTMKATKKESVNNHPTTGVKINVLLLYGISLFSFNVKLIWPTQGDVCSIQHHVINTVCDLRQFGGFLRILRFPPPITEL